METTQPQNVTNCATYRVLAKAKERERIKERVSDRVRVRVRRTCTIAYSLE
jgi:hypothetical protein